jgi:large subunit ribosomal protein L21
MATAKTAKKAVKKTAKKDVEKAPKVVVKPAKKAPKAKSEEFAVIETGGKQYVVSEGDTLTIEKLSGEHADGDKITFENVLLVDDGKNTTIGTPYIKGAKVIARFLEAGKGKKITVIKYKQKSRYFKKRGHRQPFFKVQIESLK